jgi:hypothetical protein
MPNTLPHPLGLFEDKFVSIQEVVRTVYVDVGERQFKLEVRQQEAPNDPNADYFEVAYFEDRDGQYVHVTYLPEAYGRSRETALAEALDWIAQRYPYKAKRKNA